MSSIEDHVERRSVLAAAVVAELGLTQEWSFVEPLMQQRRTFGTEAMALALAKEYDRDVQQRVVGPWRPVSPKEQP